MKAGINHFLDTYKQDLTKALKDGLLTEADMDAALRNLLTGLSAAGGDGPAGGGSVWEASGARRGGQAAAVGARVEQGTGAGGDG